MKILLHISLLTSVIYIYMVKPNNRFKTIIKYERCSVSDLKNFKKLLEEQNQVLDKVVFQPTTKDLIKYLNEIIKDDSVTILINKPKT
jgi:hypothetical protein